MMLVASCRSLAVKSRTQCLWAEIVPSLKFPLISDFCLLRESKKIS